MLHMFIVLHSGCCNLGEACGQADALRNPETIRPSPVPVCKHRRGANERPEPAGNVETDQALSHCQTPCQQPSLSGGASGHPKSEAQGKAHDIDQGSQTCVDARTYTRAWQACGC